MDHGYLKPAPPAIAKAGMPTLLYPPESGGVNTTPLEMNGKIHPGTAASEFGAYMIVGREVTVKRFLNEYGAACVFTKGNSPIVVSKWSHNKNNKATRDLQMGVGIAKTLASAMKGTVQDSAFVGGGTAVKGGLSAGKIIYDAIKSKKINLDKVPDPDGTHFKQFVNFFKQIKDNATGDRVVLMASVLATPPKVASTYNSGKQTLTFANLASIMKGL